jgi:uncharacterized protein (TIGR00730 family)
LFYEFAARRIILSIRYQEFPRQTIDALGIKTSYVTAGKPDGQPVMLLHGMTDTGDLYRELMHELADEFWLIAPDIPGFGYSDSTTPFTFPHLVEWLAAFGEALDLPPMVLVGHSFGGSLAASYTLSYPEDVTRLLLLAPAVLASKLYPHYLTRAGITLGLVDLGTAVSQSRAMVSQQVKLSFYDPDGRDDDFWERRIRGYDLARAAADVIKTVAFQDIREELDQIKQPVCIVWGEDDPVIPSSQAQELASYFPEAQAHILKECGHILILEQQAQVQAITRAFARGEDVGQALANLPPPVGERPVISVFGSSAPVPGSAAYDEAREVGRLLAEAGFAVATGGYSGTMTAVSQGAADAGGHVIGVTSDQIEQFRNLGPNQWVKEEIRYRTLQERLLHLVENNAGMIVLPGGIGTLSEMALAWSFLQVGEIEQRPLTLLGPTWQETIAVFNQTNIVRPEHMQLLHFAETPQAAVTHIVERVSALQD